MPDLFLRPVLLRSVHRTESCRKATWLELFFDLAFVAAVSQVGGPLAEHYSPDGLLRYGLLLFMIWWAWLGHTSYATRFDTDDMVQRLLTLAQIFGVGVMAINADEALDSRSSAGFAAAYAALRIVLAVQFLRARHAPGAHRFATRTAAATGLGGLVWLASAVTPAPARFWLWGLALACDVATPMVTARDTAEVPPDAEHLPERFGLFTIILLGESLVAVMHGMKSQDGWTLAAASSALLGMTMTFTIWWWYFDGVDAAGQRHVRSPRDAWLHTVWTFAHLPLYLGIGVAGVGAEHVIKVAPVQPLHASEAWLLAGGLALAMLAVTIIAAAQPSRPGHAPSPRALVKHATLTVATLLVAAIGTRINAAAFLLALVALAVGQVLVSLGRGGRAAVAPEVTLAESPATSGGVA